MGWPPRILWAAALVGLLGFCCGSEQSVFGFATPIHLQLMFGGGIGNGMPHKVIMMSVLMGLINSLTLVYSMLKVKTAKVLEGSEDVLVEVWPLTPAERLQMQERAAEAAAAETLKLEKSAAPGGMAVGESVAETDVAQALHAEDGVTRTAEQNSPEVLRLDANDNSEEKPMKTNGGQRWRDNNCEQHFSS